eukprot:scaffold12971_cov68-Cyclotella_meneghiniana.AAC.14
MKLIRRKKQKVNQHAAEDDNSCRPSLTSSHHCLDDMLNKLAEESTTDLNGEIVDPRLSLLKSLELAAEAKSDECEGMKLKRLRSKILSNFMRMDERSGHYVNWNFDSFDEEVGCEVIDHSTPSQTISAIRVNQLPPESPKYNPKDEVFEVKMDSNKSMGDNIGLPAESGFEVSNSIHGMKFIRPAGVPWYNNLVVSDESLAKTSVSSDEMYSDASDCLDRCDCGLYETADMTNDSYIGVEILLA